MPVKTRYHLNALFLLVLLDLGACVLGIEHAVTGLEVNGDASAVVQEFAVAHSDDQGLLGLLLGRVGQEKAALGLLCALHGPAELVANLTVWLPEVPENPCVPKFQ